MGGGGAIGAVCTLSFGFDRVTPPHRERGEHTARLGDPISWQRLNAVSAGALTQRRLMSLKVAPLKLALVVPALHARNSIKLADFTRKAVTHIVSGRLVPHPGASKLCIVTRAHLRGRSEGRS